MESDCRQFPGLRMCYPGPFCHNSPQAGLPRILPKNETWCPPSALPIEDPCAGQA